MACLNFSDLAPAPRTTSEHDLSRALALSTLQLFVESWARASLTSRGRRQVYANKLEVDLPLVERAVNNAFKTMLLDGTWRASLYQHLSFFNHACRPNASPTIAHQEGGDASAATSSGCKVRTSPT